MKKCYIIVLNYKNWDDTLGCLRSVFESTYPEFTLVVIDNNSQNDSIGHIISDISAKPVIKASSGQAIRFLHIQHNELDETRPSDYPDLVLVQNHRNAGFGGGNNIILRKLAGENSYIWLLNPDMTIETNTLEHFVKAASRTPKSILGSVTKSFDQPERVLFYGGGKIHFFAGTVSLSKTKEQVKDIDYISGGSMFFHGTYLETLGLLPEWYFLYWEETDWCYRAGKQGYLLDVCFEAVCYDKISTTIGRGFLSDYFYTRNALLFLQKYKPWYVVTAIFAVFARIFMRIVRGEKKRAHGMIKGVTDFLTGRRYENQ